MKGRDGKGRKGKRWKVKEREGKGREENSRKKFYEKQLKWLQNYVDKCNSRDFFKQGNRMK
jgi:hypothetical protein